MMDREQIVNEIESLVKNLKATGGWVKKESGERWFNHEILSDALTVIHELTEENDGLRDKLTETEIPFEQALDRVKWLEIKIESLKADIVRKMQERLNQVFGNAGVTGVLLCQIFDQVAKELLEEAK